MLLANQLGNASMYTITDLLCRSAWKVKYLITKNVQIQSQKAQIFKILWGRYVPRPPSVGMLHMLVCCVSMVVKCQYKQIIALYFHCSKELQLHIIARYVAKSVKMSDHLFKGCFSPDDGICAIINILVRKHIQLHTGIVLSRSIVLNECTVYIKMCTIVLGVKEISLMDTGSKNNQSNNTSSSMEGMQ